MAAKWTKYRMFKTCAEGAYRKPHSSNVIKLPEDAVIVGISENEDAYWPWIWYLVPDNVMVGGEQS